MYINDISHCIKYSTIRCFADDTRICKAITCEGDVKALQDDLDAVVEWSVNNNMTLHEDKFEYICHSAKKTNYLRHLPFVSEFYQYKKSMDILSPVQQLKDLGILVSQDLSWSTHIRSTCDKARQKCVLHQKPNSNVKSIQINGTKPSGILFTSLESYKNH